jgi:hypothetical protein
MINSVFRYLLGFFISFLSINAVFGRIGEESFVAGQILVKFSPSVRQLSTQPYTLLKRDRW